MAAEKISADAEDKVFRAVASGSRRALLEILNADDGQPLGAMAVRMRMTRQAVARHLAVLEDAGLVVSVRRSREKLHFLNPHVLQRVCGGWLSAFYPPAEIQRRAGGSYPKDRP